MDAHFLVHLKPNPNMQDFAPGDTVKVTLRIKEKDREHVQLFQGMVIRKRGSGPGASFTVRRVTHGVGVERTFPLYSPMIGALEVMRKGDVRRARLYYLRGLSGRAARIKEKGRPAP